MAQDGPPAAVLQPRPREHPAGDAVRAAARRGRCHAQRSGAQAAFVLTAAAASAVALHGLAARCGQIGFYIGNDTESAKDYPYMRSQRTKIFDPHFVEMQR